MKLTEILSNPVRARVVQYLQIHREATTRQISQYLDDIPAPTLYRHINYLVKEGVLLVKEERKVRGTTERLLVINEGVWSSDDLTDTAYQFLISIYRSFEEYGRQDSLDPVKDMLCLRTCMLRLSDERFGNFLKEYAELLGRYMEGDDGGKLRSISIISAPVKEGE